MPHEQIETWSRVPGRRGSLTPLRGSKYRIIDAHLHVMNFVQETPGGDALLYCMDGQHRQSRGFRPAGLKALDRVRP
jgi:hypothetical protein